MNKLFVTAAIAMGFFVLASTRVEAQPRPNLYRQSFSRPAPRPLPVVRATYVSPYNYVAPYTNWSTPYAPNSYVQPAYGYPNYYQSTYPSYYQNSYPSFYQSTYPSYNPYAYPSYYTPGAYYGRPF